MASFSSQQRQAIQRCQQSVCWFLRNFGKIKHPSAGILPFHPFSYQRRAIKAFRKYRLNIFRKCIAEGSPVWTPTGPKLIETLKSGDQVYSYNEQTGHLEIDLVTAAWCNGEKEVYEVRTTSGRCCAATIDHKLFTNHGWKEIGDFKHNEMLPISSQASLDATIELETVKSILPVGVAKVYDLEVAKNHNFVVDGIQAHNCRQAGISKISGAFALWFAMFFNHKTILIVSRTDDTAMEFLRDQIMFLFDNLPEWMKEAWKPTKRNDHEVHFPNGSKIKSLTSHPDVLRSNASSLNIIDEAAFINNMDVLWSGGWPTLQHGGNVIVISTTCGIGNWYWSTVTDAEAGVNQFNPVNIRWWDMDWVIEYTDAISREQRRIAPRDGLVKCDGMMTKHPKFGDVKLDPIRYGAYWSPWLEEQYRALQEKGEAWKFEQEVLAEFVGSGNTVLPKEVLAHIQTTIKDPLHKVSGLQTYVHPVNGSTDEIDFDFGEPDEGLWVWEKPVLARPLKKRGNIIIDPGQPAHSYVMGVDIATGKGRDYSTIEVFDVDERAQVAEFMARCLPREFVRFIDRIGRWYNCALAVVERNNGGDTLIDSLRHDVMYPRLWRKKDINDKPRPSHGRLKQRPLKVAPYGFSTSVASKPTLNKFLLDFIRTSPEEGYTIFSKRLLKQFNTYVRKRDRSGRDTTKTEAEDGAGNYDDLVIACALGLLGTSDAIIVDSSNLMPMGSGGDFKSQAGPTIFSDETRAALQQGAAVHGGPSLLMPMVLAGGDPPEISVQRQVEAFACQLGGIPLSQGKPLVTPKRYYYDRE